MSTNSVAEASQHLTFNLGEEVFAVDISKVREVIEFPAITKVPQTPEFMSGVINLRGSVVPVVDLRLKFGMTETERTVNTCIIIVEISLDEETAIVGALADAVQEVLEFEEDQINPTPKIGMKLKTDFIQGMGRKDDKFIIILDIDKVFSMDELVAVQDAENHIPLEIKN